MTNRARRRLLAGGVVLALLAATAVVVLWATREEEPDTGLARAVALAPATTERFSWTDWAAVRAEVGAELSTSSAARDVRRFLDDAYSADLTSTSAMVSPAEALHERLGLSPATASWELFTQGVDGALLLVGLPGDFDAEAFEDRLREVGYEEPRGDDTLWAADVGRVSEVGFTPEMTYVAVDTERDVVATSDDANYLLDMDDGARDDTDDGVTAAVAAMGEPLAASVLTGDNACAELAMTRADGPDRVRAEQLIDQAGDVGPYRGFAMGLLPDGELRVALAFETAEQARVNADSRARLLAGPAPGQGGSFPDRFTVDRVEADGEVVTMRLDPVEGSYPLSDLSSGPVLFATC